MSSERMIYIVTAFTRIGGSYFLKKGKFQQDEVVHEEYLGETHYFSLEATSKRVISTIAICMSITL
jgi:hypothetical protein